jgi:hypothetical protein
MTRRFLKPLVSLAALAFAIMPTAAQAAPLDATSVYTAGFGGGGPVTPPDANGDSFGSFFDGGTIAGAFNAQVVPNANRGMVWMFNYVVHTRTGILEGTGTAICNQCMVAGLAGTVSFTVTESGHGTLSSCGLQLCAQITIDGGTWAISGATGALMGITGSGSWTQSLLLNKRFLTGSILLSAGCDSTGNGNGNDQCEQ